MRVVPADPLLARTTENLNIMYPRKEWLTIPNLGAKKFANRNFYRLLLFLRQCPPPALIPRLRVYGVSFLLLIWKRALFCVARGAFGAAGCGVRLWSG